jgi:hypothetical protein
MMNITAYKHKLITVPQESNFMSGRSLATVIRIVGMTVESVQCIEWGRRLSEMTSYYYKTY